MFIHNRRIILFMFFMSVGLMQITFAESYLLKPTGKYGIGYQDIYLINSNVCPDLFYQKNKNESQFSHGNKKYCHELVLRAYYPTLKKIEHHDEYYAPFLLEENRWLIKTNKISKNYAEKLNTILNVKTYTEKDISPVSGKKFPIIIFMPGSGSPAQAYTNIITNLVSHGFVVIGVNSAFINGALQLKDGQVVAPPMAYLDVNGRKNNISDLQYVLTHLDSIPFKDNLKKSMGFNHIGLIGHSRGAMSIVHAFNQNDPRIKAIILLDPGDMLFQKNYPIQLFKIPRLVIWSSDFKKSMKGSALTDNDKNKQIILTIGNNDDNYSNHNNFTDASTMQYHPAYTNLNVHKDFTVGMGNGIDIAKTIDDETLKYFLKHL